MKKLTVEEKKELVKGMIKSLKESDFPTSAGKLLRKRREEAGLTQAQLAELVVADGSKYIDCYDLISKVERGVRPLTYDFACALSKHLNTSPEELFGFGNLFLDVTEMLFAKEYKQPTYKSFFSRIVLFFLQRKSITFNCVNEKDESFVVAAKDVNFFVWDSPYINCDEYAESLVIQSVNRIHPTKETISYSDFQKKIKTLRRKILNWYDDL